MKKIIIFAFLGTSLLSGCKESTTGLQKNVINATYGICSNELKDRLKSPSSLKINDIAVVNYNTPLDQIYGMEAKNLFKDNNSSEIKDEYQHNDTRYRSINTVIEYEAQNSFGVYLPNKFTCYFSYSLSASDTNESPKHISLVFLKSGEELMANSMTVNIDNYSNFKLDHDFILISNDGGNGFTEEDKKLIPELKKIRQKELDEQKILDERNALGTAVDSAPNEKNEVEKVVAEAEKAAREASAN